MVFNLILIGIKIEKIPIVISLKTIVINILFFNILDKNHCLPVLV